MHDAGASLTSEKYHTIQHSTSGCEMIMIIVTYQNCQEGQWQGWARHILTAFNLAGQKQPTRHT